jgi:carboxyl-terminal processing protease
MSRAVPSRSESPFARRVGVLLIAVLAPACGDNAIYPESVYAQRCAQPRAGIDPGTRQPYPDVAGTVMQEKLWIHSWINDLYLWYREVPSVDITAFATAIEYFDQEKTPLKTASGKPKDQFHFIYDTPTWEALSQSGTEASYGVQWALLAPSPPRSLVIAYIQPGSPAAAANLGRGAKVLSIDGVDVERGSDVDTLNEGLFPSNLDETHSFVVQDLGATTTRTVTLTSTSVEINPVLNVRTLPAPNDKIGYFLFTDHIATAEKALFDAFTQLRAAGVTDLILDLRYNGGGYLYIASELAYMIAGPARTSGKTFEKLNYNAKRTSDNTRAPYPFQATSTGNAALPTLDLSRVYVLTTSETCSASESVINSLRGVDVDVRQIGSTSCGKPYGFAAQDNCGISYFPIEFQGVNAKGFGDYADGFTPNGAGATGIAGCTAADDFTQPLGSKDEGMLKAALAYRASGTCPVAASQESPQALSVLAGGGAALRGRPLLSNRFLKPSR